ncbi:MAG: glycosyltransferase [Candidatus Kapaibacteriales bacterium]
MNNNSIKISFCIIVKNEEKFIGNCLKSISAVADEIIIVDTGSTDKTIEIAKSFTNKIFYFPWNNNFSEARNHALSYAQYPIIFSIDADEELQNPEAVFEALRKAKDNVGGWFVANISLASKKDSSGFDTYATKMVRMFRNQPDIRFRGIIHEQIQDSILQKGFQLSDSEIVLIHYGYSLDPDSMKKKQLRNLELLLQDLKLKPNSAYTHFQLAKTYLALERLVEAEEYIQKAIQYANPTGSILPQAFCYGGIIAFRYGNYELALERAKNSLKLIPNQSFANFILGEVYSAMLEYSKALESYQKMSFYQQNINLLTMIVGDYFLPKNQLLFRIGRCYIGLGQPANAEKYFRQGFELAFDFDNLRGLANAIVMQKRFAEARELLLNYSKSNPNQKEEIDKILIQIDRLEHIEKGRISFKVNSFAKEHPVDIITPKPDSKILATLSMIVKNEEKYLAGCIESVLDLVDEIVIIDTGSNDRTKEIAQQYGAKIYDFEWKDDFALARNEALKFSTGRWIIYLDADERIVYPEPKILRRMLKEAPAEIGGFYCTIESEHFQMDGSTEIHRGGYPRIFRNLGFPKLRFIGRVHEQIAPSIFENNLQIAFSDIKILHLGYNQSREVMEAKIRRNYRLLIQHVQEEPLNGYAWYQLGQTLAQMTLFTEAEKAIRMAIQTKTLTKPIFANAASTLAKMLGNKGNYSEALFWAEKSLDAVPEQIYALHLKAYALLYLQRFEEAETFFNEVIKLLRSKKGMPLTGFDIQIPEEIVLKGLDMARRRVAPFR